MSVEGVKAAIQRALGIKPDRVELIPTDEYNTVYRAEADGKGYFFKSHGEDEIRAEAWACERARAAGVPAPVVISLDSTGEYYPMPYMLTEEVPGRELATLDMDDEALRSMGRCLRQLHSVTLEGAGRFDLGHLRKMGTARGSFGSEREVLCNDRYGLPYLEEKKIVPRSLLVTIRAIVEHGSSIFNGPSVLLHGDLGTDHVFVDPSTRAVTGIVDFGDAAAGDRAREFACMAIHETARLGPVLEGYEPDATMMSAFENKLALCVLARLTGEIRWQHERGMSVAEPVERLRAAVRAFEF